MGDGDSLHGGGEEGRIAETGGENVDLRKPVQFSLVDSYVSVEVCCDQSPKFG